MNIKHLVRKNILELKPYATARDDFKGKASIFLDANESPYPSEYNRYPDPTQRALKLKLAEIKKVRPEQIFLGNGSDEAIDLLMRVFCEPGIDSVLVPQPTYGMYAVSAAVNNVKVRSVSLTKDFDLDVDATVQTCDASTKIIFLCSPNNPTGNLLQPDKVEDLIHKVQAMVVIDEAYIDFATHPGFIPKLEHFPNLVVLQTLSKAWGLASLRLGLCLGHPQLIEWLSKVKYPYNINGFTQTEALARISDERKTRDAIDQLIRQRKELAFRLQTLGCVLHVYPSEANFLLVRFTNAQGVFHFLQQAGIIVRDRSNQPGCDNCLRITVGTPEENSQLINQLIRYEKSITD
jgi:histidinol-phosphate aminotransferase